MLCPMHLPVILCGFICGWPYGFIVGIIAPILRFVTLGMLPLFPIGFAMSFELATYGFTAGIFYNVIFRKLIKNNNIQIYLSLICSMIIGRIVFGIVMFILMGLGFADYSFSIFFTGTIINAIPGIILQIILIPIIIILYNKIKPKYIK